MALIVVGVGAWVGYRELRAAACSGELRLTVAAAEEIAPAVQATVDQWAKDRPAVDGTCVAVAVTASDPTEVAAVVAGDHGVAITGVGQAPGTATLPDVWIPDSSMWIVRLQTAAAGFVPAEATSIARSPVVLAMPQPVADQLGWPQQRISYDQLLQQMTSGSGLKTGIVEPTRDATGLSGLLALAAAAQGSGGQAGATAALRALAQGASRLRKDLLERFPQAANPSAIAAAVSAAPLSEQDVIAYNQIKPAVPLAAVYLDPAPIALDYPYAVMPGLDGAKGDAAAALRKQLAGPQFADRLAAQGLRAADGTVGTGLVLPAGAPSPAPLGGTPASTDSGGGGAGGPQPAAVERALSTWTAVTLPGRLLAVLDVSGSMKAPVPTANNLPRMTVTVEAAKQGLTLFDDSWAVGLWTFSTELVGSQDWRELVPIGPLSSQREKLATALSGIRPKDNGDTGLHDTLLAAYKAVQTGWVGGRVNSVVVMTDGENDDANGISLDQLTVQLKKIADPKRPIQVVIIGIGPDVKKASLDPITQVTGGGVFVAEDPAKIGEIFLRAISLRSQAPR
ncbi:VWA domain-containing protein [Rhizomonospora bruguierae]|uniref:VWA domain-containing protein n=1 Tax=Rhizomonospora bruguierae TaxID=1581705 RepID=UPI0020C12166|nr:VWA domain-containing protein [Micromonospora sp. NBRC 107566]